MVWMAAFHFFFDLNYFGLIRQNFYTDPFWTVQRAIIVSLFMFCVGLGQAVALQQVQGWPRFWRRWWQIVACAVLVSMGSWLMFPRSFISFGVLHGIALILVIARLSAGWGNWLWLAGLLAVLAPQFVQHDWFDTRWTNWVGLVTRKPVTEDYAPLLPWLGVVWWGLAAGQWVLRLRPEWFSGTLMSTIQPLALLGRWSLSFYILHQPVLIGLVLAWVTVTR